MAALCLALSLIFPRPSIAEDLEGRLYLGKSLDIKLEKREGMLSEFLRYLKLVDSPRQVVNLSELGKRGDQVFIGEDLKLYFSSEKHDGAAFPIGSASKLWEFRVDNDVEFLKVAELSQILDPDGCKVGRKLRVKTEKNRPRAHNAQQANFEFWLEELVFEYDRYNPRAKTEENYPYIIRAIETALPSPEDQSDYKMDNLKFLHRYVRQTRGVDLIPLRELLDNLLKEYGELGFQEEIMDKYREIKDIVYKKTEGL